MMVTSLEGKPELERYSSIFVYKSTRRLISVWTSKNFVTTVYIMFVYILQLFSYQDKFTFLFI